VADARGPIAAGLDARCPACNRMTGDHTLREWADCVETQRTDMPFEEIAPDLAGLASENLRRSFDLDGDILVADHVVIRAVTLDGAHGPIRVRMPGLLHEFQIGVIGQVPTPVAKVLFLGDPQSMRGYGRLVRDSANGAINAIERDASA
jgi:hypothetical protein